MPGRVEGPQHLSNAVLFLASDEARYVTGVTFPVDTAAQYVARPGWEVGPGGPTRRLGQVLVTFADAQSSPQHRPPGPATRVRWPVSHRRQAGREVRSEREGSAWDELKAGSP